MIRVGDRVRVRPIGSAANVEGTVTVVEHPADGPGWLRIVSPTTGLWLVPANRCDRVPS